MTARNQLLLLGELRDGFIVLGGAVYLAGYITWAFYAWDIGAGPIPALESQYFAIGFPIAVLCIVFTLVASLFRRTLAKRWQSRLDALPFVRRLLLVMLTAVAAAGCLRLAEPLTKTSDPTFRQIALIATLFLLACALLATCLILWPAPRNLFPLTWGVALSIMLIAVLSGMVFIRALYSRVPPELGGGALRPAMLDVDCSRLSKQTCADLGITTEAAGAYRTRPLFVVSAPDDALLVLVGAGTYRSHLHLSIRKDAIQAIVWLPTDK